MLCKYLWIWKWSCSTWWWWCYERMESIFPFCSERLFTLNDDECMDWLKMVIKLLQDVMRMTDEDNVGRCKWSSRRKWWCEPCWNGKNRWRVTMMGWKVMKREEFFSSPSFGFVRGVHGVKRWMNDSMARSKVTFSSLFLPLVLWILLSPQRGINCRLH